MNWIFALLAFAGVMAVLSTVVSVLVEAVHKTFALRGSGLQKMLRDLHDDVLYDVEGPEARTDIGEVRRRRGGKSVEARDFALDMTQSQSRGWHPALSRAIVNVPLLNLFQRRFDRLTRLQFAEQLSQTDVGRRLLEENDRGKIQTALSQAIYQFDRYGVMQTSFFRQRAKTLTTLFSLVFVTFANVNALEIYRHLAANENAAEAALAFVGAGEETAVATLDSAADALTTRLDALESTLDAGLDDKDLAREIGRAHRGVEDFQTSFRAASLEIDALADVGLPIGRAYFPYCNGVGATDPTVDPRCVSDRFVENFAGSIWDGIVWVLLMIATAGLIGLGGPFWFDLFHTLAVIAGRRAPPNLSAEDRAALAAPERRRTLGRPDEDVDIEAATDAFLLTGGKRIAAAPGAPPPGIRRGASSAEMIAGGAPGGTSDPPSPTPAGMRRVRR